MQRNLFRLARLVLLCGLGMASQWTLAGDFEWSGTYRVEAVHVSNSELNSKNRDKDYGLHHLILNPKIVAADGITIRSRFDIFNNGDAAYSSSQIGQFFGSGIRGGGTAATSTNANDSNVVSDRQMSESFQVNLLYMTLTQENGQLIVGRAPIHFGLGLVHNAGSGLFDHWFDNRDLVGYKMIMGNFYFLPMMGKVSESKLADNDDVTDYLFELHYENPDTDLEMGLFYQIRKAGVSGNDLPVTAGTGTDQVFGDAGTTITDQYDTQHWNLFALKDTERFRFGLEAGFNSGSTGGETATTVESISLGGFGLAIEGEYRPEGSDFKYGGFLGMASGDDPNTENKYEAFVFDRNYDVAILMFNHPLGQENALRSQVVGGGPKANKVDEADVEAISNVVYVSPYLKYRWTDKWNVLTSLTLGIVNQDFHATDTATDLGYELDVSLDYKPSEKILWRTQMAMLFPGGAFENGGHDASFAYGLITKVAIGF